jgi:diphthine-ammonia ligase
MKLGILFSGGKDSCYALYKAKKEHEIVCLITMASDNPDSYMFHTPNIELTKLQSEALDIPLISGITKGEKEDELKDLKDLIKKAKEKFKLDGIVTGAIRSEYQATRIQKICDELKLKCINPLWHKDQIELLNELLENKFEVIITRVAAYPFDEKLLGKKIDEEVIKKLADMNKKYQINPAGEGGEIETFVTDMPLFKKKIEIEKFSKKYANNEGSFTIEKAELG